MPETGIKRIGRDAVGIVLICGAAYLLTRVLPDLHGVQPTLVAGAALTLLAGLVLGPVLAGDHAAPARVALWTGLASLALAVPTGAPYATLEPALVLRLALAVGVLAWTVAAAATLLQRRATPGVAFGLTIPVTLVLALAPLWAGPLLAAVAPGGSGVDALLAASPLTYLAQAVEWDYLRYDWIYRATPLGALRFDYPAFWPATLAYVGLAGTLHAIAHRLQRPGPMRAPTLRTTTT